MGIIEVPKGIKFRFNIIFWVLVVLQISAIILCETQFKEKSEIDEYLFYPILVVAFFSFIISIVFRIISRNLNLMKKFSELPFKKILKIFMKKRRRKVKDETKMIIKS